MSYRDLEDAATAILNLLEDGVDPLTGEELDSEGMAGKLTILELDIERAVGAAGCAYRQLLTEADGLQAEAEAFTRRRASVRKRADRLRDAVQLTLERLGRQKVASPWGSATLQAGPPRVVLDAPLDTILSEWPDCEAYSAPRADLNKIKEYLLGADGESTEWAHLERDTHLRFRV